MPPSCRSVRTPAAARSTPGAVPDRALVGQPLPPHACNRHYQQEHHCFHGSTSVIHLRVPGNVGSILGIERPRLDKVGKAVDAPTVRVVRNRLKPGLPVKKTGAQGARFSYIRGSVSPAVVADTPSIHLFTGGIAPRPHLGSCHAYPLLAIASQYGPALTYHAVVAGFL
jgi:hypothetical protein